jgi:rRNA maturation endonuclease Nob1
MIAETELDRLLEKKNVIYRNLRDLEFEHKMGRLSDTDFQQLEAGYKSEAAGLLQRLDQLDADDLTDASIEKDIAARKARLNRSRPKGQKESRRCPACGAEAMPGKQYCGDCGHHL